MGGAAGRAGSRAVAYAPTNDSESGSGVGGQMGKFVTLTAMTAYKGKSVEELRWEDYQAGDKGKGGRVRRGLNFGYMSSYYWLLITDS